MKWKQERNYKTFLRFSVHLNTIVKVNDNAYKILDDLYEIIIVLVFYGLLLVLLSSYPHRKLKALLTFVSPQVLYRTVWG